MLRAAVTGVAATAALATAGCGGGPDARTAEGSRTLPQGADPVQLDPSAFTTEIDNRWWPMRPGTRWTYRETDTEGAELRVVVTVTERTKRIANGITARVVRDTVSEDGELVEDTFDWYAQDDDGTVWYLGEDTAEFEAGRLTTREGSFEAGVGGALPGVIMPGAPRPGQRYRQEYLEGEAEDNGEVLSLREMAETPYGRFDGALLTKDTTAVEPGVLEYKLYAPGVGPVLVLGVSGGPGGREELVAFDRAPARWTQRAGDAPLGEGPVSRAP